MTMALYPSILTQTNLFSPAKPKPLSSTSKPLFLRTPCLILRLHSPTPSSSTFSAKPISQISLTTSLRASSPQKYVYPDPIPEFAEAEIRKFRAEVLRKLLKDKDTFGEELDAVVDVCAEDWEMKSAIWGRYSVFDSIFQEFLQSQTLLQNATSFKTIVFYLEKSREA
ncbi:protein PLASTID REDOX INSENSITIVE 2, chloroplastic-like isoform X3 [Quercus lobata]|uniref:protein PLASTID REDOX INSENSITIVE 2, chloroplastic-like isoform X3 n=1 Tax=Quercus lobata TaxID=97700 RepID=UPI0012483A25|nr:protein PLASTID REDOX INSENSITIVE 2, chloroplastic-like isoform X3 [Quercus lobata]